MEQENYEMLLNRFTELEEKLQLQEERLKDMVEFNKSLLNQKQEPPIKQDSTQDLKDKLEKGLRI